MERGRDAGRTVKRCPGWTPAFLSSPAFSALAFSSQVPFTLRLILSCLSARPCPGGGGLPLPTHPGKSRGKSSDFKASPKVCSSSRPGFCGSSLLLQILRWHPPRVFPVLLIREYVSVAGSFTDILICVFISAFAGSLLYKGSRAFLCSCPRGMVPVERPKPRHLAFVSPKPPRFGRRSCQPGRKRGEAWNFENRVRKRERDVDSWWAGGRGGVKARRPSSWQDIGPCL